MTGPNHLLEAETDHELPQRPPVLPVEVCGNVVTEEVTAQALSTHTLQVAANAIEELAPADQLRTRLVITRTGARGPLQATQAQPGAGANAVYTVPVPMRLKSVTFQIVTSSGAANRLPELIIEDASSNIIAWNQDFTAQTASKTLNASFTDGFNFAPDSVSGAMPGALPRDLVLQPNWTITMGAANLQSGDQVSAVIIEYEPLWEGGLVLCHSKAIADMIAKTGTIAQPPAGLGGGCQVIAPMELRTTARMWVVDITGVPNAVSYFIERRQP